MTHNKLYYGDNLEVLRKYVRDDSVDLCYIDPPFNSKRNYNQIYNNIGGEDRAQAQAFVDTWTWDAHANECFEQILDNTNGVQTRQSIELIRGLEKVLGRGSLFAYLVSMNVRIAEIHRVLKATGSFYLHCDPTASHYLKLVCDAIFCGERGGDYKNEIVWARTNAHNIASKYFARVQDTVFFYTKSDKYIWNAPYTDFSPQQLKRYFRDPETGRLATGQDLTMTGNAHRNFTWRGTTPPPHRGWGFSEEQLEELWEQGLILKKQDGTPRLDGRKVFLDEKQGKPLGSVWADIERIGNTASERLGYPTQKPEALLERIISASSNEGDTILDAFCGCGTSVVVAQRLKRQWIGIDITYQSIALVVKRLEDSFGKTVTAEIELNGVPRDMESVRALVNKRDDRVRKEFEKWAILTYSDNRAVINEKKGADKGIDGVAYVAVGRDAEKSGIKHLPVMLSVKSGKVGASVIRDLRGVVEREGAAGGILLTLDEPTKPMLEEARQAGQFKGDFATFERLQIVTVQQILDGERMRLPLLAEVAKRAKSKSDAKQMGMYTEE